MHNIQLKSILDNDFYKFTMQNAVVKLFPNSIVKYQFINRGKHIFPEGFGKALRKLVDAMADLPIWICLIWIFWKATDTTPPKCI